MALTNKIAIVTGGIRGIGRGIVEELMDEGADVLTTYCEEDEYAAPLLQELKAYAENKNVRFASFRINISEVDRIKKMFDFCEKELGRVDILIANVGIYGPKIPMWEHTEEIFDNISDVNFKGTYFCVRECSTRMNDNGRIVLISASVRHYPVAGHSCFSNTKAAVEELAREASIELGPRGITVNCVAPGITPQPGQFPEELLDLICRTSPRGRIGTFRDVSGAVVMFCQPKSGWVTGQTIIANGGSSF